MGSQKVFNELRERNTVQGVYEVCLPSTGVCIRPSKLGTDDTNTDVLENWESKLDMTVHTCNHGTWSTQQDVSKQKTKQKTQNKTPNQNTEQSHKMQ